MCRLAVSLALAREEGFKLCSVDVTAGCERAQTTGLVLMSQQECRCYSRIRTCSNDESCVDVTAGV